MSFNGNQYPSSDEGLNLTTKGQIHTHDSSANAALSVGSNTHVLTADSTETTGMKWAAAASGGATTAQSSAALTSIFTTTSGTMTDITGLSVTV